MNTVWRRGFGTIPCTPVTSQSRLSTQPRKRRSREVARRGHFADDLVFRGVDEVASYWLAFTSTRGAVFRASAPGLHVSDRSGSSTLGHPSVQSTHQNRDHGKEARMALRT
jgi:hypothetical protein